MTLATRREFNKKFDIKLPPLHPKDEARIRLRLKDWPEVAVLRVLDNIRQYGPFDQALIMTGMKA